MAILRTVRRRNKNHQTKRPIEEMQEFSTYIQQIHHFSQCRHLSTRDGVARLFDWSFAIIPIAFCRERNLLCFTLCGLLRTIQAHDI